jgi:hypothetical protein
MPNELALPARCRICNKIFYGPRVSILGTAGRAESFLNNLQLHVKTEHKEVAREIAMGAMEYQGMMTMALYLIEDPELQKQLDLSRWNTHQKTLAAHISDDDIARVVEQLIPEIYTLVQQGDTVQLRTNLLSCFANLRDRLEEPNKYSIQPVSV